MTLLMLLVVFLLHHEDIRGVLVYHNVYQKPGDDAFLPNMQVSLPATRCSDFDWLHYKKQEFISKEVRDGKVSEESARSSRLSLHSNCSLMISNVTAEDFGLFICRYRKANEWDTQVFLNILTISPSSIDADVSEDGEVTFTCSLLSSHAQCAPGSVRWVDEDGAELDDDGDGFTKGGQKNCATYLTVKNPREQSRRFTCQYVDGSEVKVEVPYITSTSAPVRDWTIIFIAAGAAGLSVLLLVMAVILLKRRRRQVRVKKDVAKPTNNALKETEVAYATIEECHTAECQDETESGMTYVTVNHSNKKRDQKKKVKVEERLEDVTYAAVRTR